MSDTTNSQTIEIWRISKDFEGFRRILLHFNGIVRRVDRFFGTYLPWDTSRSASWLSKTPLLLKIQWGGDSWRTVERCSRWPSHFGGPFFGYLRVSSLHLSTVRHESPSCWIFKSKNVLESQDADLEMSQGSYVPKNLSIWRTMPLKSSKILSNPFKSFEILPISIVWQIVVQL